VNKSKQEVLDALNPNAPRTWWPVGTRTITQIAESTGLPRSTVRGAVYSLLAEGKVEVFGVSCDDARVYALAGYTAARREARAIEWNAPGDGQRIVLGIDQSSR
jgi:DNA-binding IclR family transcriptional regulator